MALTNAEKVRAYKARQQDIRVATLQNHTSCGEMHERFKALIVEAQALALQINQTVVAELESQPLTLETAAPLLVLKGRAMRIDFAQIYPST